MGAMKVDLDQLLDKSEMVLIEHKRVECINEEKNQKKFYEVRIEQVPDDSESPYRCVVHYGRIGSPIGQREIKYEGKDLYTCKKTLSQLIRSKEKKGYK